MRVYFAHRTFLLLILIAIIGFMGATSCVMNQSQTIPKAPAQERHLSKFTLTSRQVVKLQPDYTFPMGEDSPGPVVFSHESHYDYDNPNCTSCHSAHFKLLEKGKSPEGPITMETMDEGKNCGACHNGDIAFDTKDPDNCSACHQEKE